MPIGVELSISTSSLISSQELLAIGTFDTTSRAGGDLRVVDLASGNQIELHETNNRVCALNWLDDTFVVYDQLIEGFCGGTTNSIWVWDTQTDSIQPTGIDGSVQIIERPEIQQPVPTTLVFLQQPNNSVEDIAIAPPIRVQALDAQNSPIANVPVSLSLGLIQRVLRSPAALRDLPTRMAKRSSPMSA